MYENKFIAPLSIRHTLLQLAHNNPLAGHFSANKTLENLAQTWYWPTMPFDVKKHIGTCHNCLSVNNNKLLVAPLQPLSSLEKFNDRVHIDLFGPLPSSYSNNKYLVVMTDAFSKWVEIQPIPSKHAHVVARAFYDKWICRFSAPKLLVSDQGSEFTADVFKTLTEQFKIPHNYSSVMHPQSNGQVERFNRTMISYLRKFIPENPEWESLIFPLQSAYNTTPHSATKYSPFYILHGRLPNIPAALFAPQRPYYGEDESKVLFSNLAKIYQNVFNEQKLAFDKMKEQHDKRIHLKEIEENDIVYINRPHKGDTFQKFQPLYEGPYRVVKLSENHNVQIQNLDTFKMSIVHVNRLKLAPFMKQHFCDKSETDQPRDKKEKNKENIRSRNLKEHHKIGNTPDDLGLVDDEEENQPVVIGQPPGPAVAPPMPPPPPPPGPPGPPPPPGPPQGPVVPPRGPGRPRGGIPRPIPRPQPPPDDLPIPGQAPATREMTREELARIPGPLTRNAMRDLGYRPGPVNTPDIPLEYRGRGRRGRRRRM